RGKKRVAAQLSVRITPKEDISMERSTTAYTVAALVMSSALLAAQTAGRGNAQDRPAFEIFTVEGQPIDRRAPELDTDHPVFPGQTHAPYRKSVDVSVSTIASNLEVPWAVASLPSGRFLITEKPGRFRILNSDGSSFRTITEHLPPIHVRGQSGLLDVALDRNYRTNHRIFFTYVRNVDADTAALAVASAVLDEDAGT